MEDRLLANLLPIQAANSRTAFGFVSARHNIPSATRTEVSICSRVACRGPALGAAIEWP
jgi:hypothetical protein